MKWMRAVGLAVGSLAALGAYGQPQGRYPEKPIRLIVPYSPGGSSDILARVVSAALTDALGQQIVVDNRAGAGGIIGAQAAAQALPDGYTLFQAVVGQMAISPHLLRNLPYDPRRDFAPIAPVAMTPLLLVANASLPATDVKSLIALARATPGKLNFSSSGNGGSTHLSGELFKTMAGIDVVHVAYKGASPSITALMGGEVAFAFDAMPHALPIGRSGKLRMLAISTLRRSSVANDIPTLDESGVPGFDSSAWFGFVAPAKTPPALVQQLNQTLNAVLKRPDVRKRVIDAGGEPLGGTSADFGRFMDTEYRKWGEVVRKAGLKQK
ncbi:MAG TPA: tripartite tricarboxylate transporter substrate binding protein [Burkholderiales bacterium]|nr:tripartite tricarboxylate transporter substrate binding protein [Burkholderiales bacterium]